MPSPPAPDPAIASGSPELLGALSCGPSECAGLQQVVTQLARVVATVVDYASALVLWLVVFVVCPSPVGLQKQSVPALAIPEESEAEKHAQEDQKQATKQFELITKLCDDLLDRGSDEDEDEAAKDPFHWASPVRRKFLRKESVSSSVMAEGPLSPRSVGGSEPDLQPDWERDAAATTEQQNEETEVVVSRTKSVSVISVPENAMEEMRQLFPEADEDILARFLIARRNVVAAASELYANHLAWRQRTLPLHDGDVAKVMETQCLYVKGRTKDGTPLLVFRGGFYDNTVASSDQYVLAAVYLLEKMVSLGMDKVTVLVNVASLPGGVNAPPDVSFIKQLASVLSDNYPERLHRLVIYPFPWFGVAVWNVVKLFIDQRTRDRIVMISGKATQGAPTPQKLYDYVDPDQLAPMLGGTDASPIDPYTVKW